jgi:Lrp/AsnC family transcriptional regulator, leucine-responsive regulatory protein
MVKNQSSGALDATDRAILKIIQTDASIKDANLARRINLSAPATHARLKRLEREGFVRGYAAQLDRDKLGFGLLCFVQVSLRAHQDDLERELQAAVSQLPEILECYQVTGQPDYLMKVVLRDRKHLESFLNARLTPLLKDARIQTSVVLTEIKATHTLPLDDAA